jgi:DNA repair ATPase RecN
MESRLTEMKASLDATTTELQTCRASEAEASTQLRNDQAALAEVQGRIERLDKALEKMGAK